MDEATDKTSEHVSVPFFMSPNAFGLPALDRGRRARSETLEIVDAQWPRIESLIREGRVPEAIEAMEALAKEMRVRTEKDPEPWWETLLMSRFVLYDNILSVALWRECAELARAALKRAAQWDVQAREHIEHLLLED